MCNVFGGPDGPSSEEKSLESQDSALSKSLESNYKTTFAEQQDVLSRLQSQISRIQSGQTGPGFSAAELAAKTSDITNQAAAGERNAAQAVRNAASGQNFAGQEDASGLARTSAVHQQIEGEIASAGETNKANALNRLTSENFEQGRKNAASTVAGLDALAGKYNPLGYATEAGSLNKQSFDQSKTIKEQQDAANAASPLNKLLNTGITAGMSFLTGGLSNLGAGESFGEGVGDFFKGGLGALSNG